MSLSTRLVQIDLPVRAILALAMVVSQTDSLLIILAEHLTTKPRPLN